MTTVNIQASTVRTTIVADNVTWAIAKATPTSVNGNVLYCGINVGLVRIMRIFLQFDTSVIPDDATITQVNLTLTVTGNNTTLDDDFRIHKQDWSAQSPIMLPNMDAAYDGCLAAAADDAIWRNSNGISLNTPYTSGNLSTAWINKTGVTYYSMLGERDYSGTAFPASDSYLIFGTPAEATEAYRPTLNIIYTPAASGAVKILPCYGTVGLGSGGVRIRPTGGTRL